MCILMKLFRCSENLNPPVMYVGPKWDQIYKVTSLCACTIPFHVRVVYLDTRGKNSKNR